MARLNIILATLVAVLLLALAACWAAIRHYGTECDRLAANNAALQQRARNWRFLSGVHRRQMNLSAVWTRAGLALTLLRSRTMSS